MQFTGIDSFNPTMVRLLHAIETIADKISDGFNPTMVRLLRTRSLTTTDGLATFQSHNGAIAAVNIASCHGG